MGTKEDLAFARAVTSGDSNACTRFVEEYTDPILSRVWQLSKTHCHYPARNSVCSLLILQRQRKGSTHSPENQCSECMDSYLWFFDQLKNKVGAYEGRNNCSLSTFVFSILKSHLLYIDWIRWKYKRCDRPPVCIERLNRVYHRVYEYLCEHIPEDEISRRLALKLEETKNMIYVIKTELLRAGMIDLVETFQHVPLHTDGPDEQDIPIPSDEQAPDEKSMEKQKRSIASKAISELPADQAQLIKLYYKDDMSVNDILGLFKKLNYSPVPNKDIAKLTVQDIYYEISKIIKKLQEIVKEHNK